MITSSLPNNNNNNNNNTNNQIQQRSVVDLPHNPYIGFFHGTLRLRSLNPNNRVYLPNTNPHVGRFRHAPSNQNSVKEKNIDENKNHVITNFITQLKDRRKNTLDDLELNIPKSQFSSSDSRFGDQPTCMICLESIIDGDEIRNLKCSHCFHSKCVDIWLLGTLSDETLNTSICPTCRKEAITNQSSPSISSDENENSQDIITPIPIFRPQTLLTNDNTNNNNNININNNDNNVSENGLSEISSNQSCQSMESQRSYLPQDKDIPREVFMSVGQYLLESGSCIDSPSPLMSPALQSNHSIDGTNVINQQPVILNSQLDPQPRSRSSSFSSISSSQSMNSNSSVSSFLSIPSSVSSGSGIYINFSILSNSLDILSIASGE